MQIYIDKKIKDFLYETTNILFEEKEYFLDENQLVNIESPSTIMGVNLNWEFSMGAFSHFNPDGYIQNCSIGRYCSLARDICIGHSGHPTDWLSSNPFQYDKNYRNYDKFFHNNIKIKQRQSYYHTFIGNDVWIGNGVFIKDGLKIGDGAILGARAVVTKDVPPYAIVAGNPAKIIRYRFSEKIIEQLLELKWWEYNFNDFTGVDFDNIVKATDQLGDLLPKLEKYYPLKLTNNDFIQLCNNINQKV